MLPSMKGTRNERLLAAAATEMWQGAASFQAPSKTVSHVPGGMH